MSSEGGRYALFAGSSGIRGTAWETDEAREQQQQVPVLLCRRSSLKKLILEFNSGGSPAFFNIIIIIHRERHLEPGVTRRRA